MGYTRRTVLATTGATAVGGCLSSPFDDEDSSEISGSAAFFALKDWSNQIGGDVISFDSPVTVGEMGHGWDPDSDIVPEIAQHDVFVYLGTPEFQWSIDVANELRADEYDIALIDAMEAISTGDLLPFVSREGNGRPGPDHDVDFDPETLDVGEFEIYAGDKVVAWWHDGHWHGGIPDVPLDESIELQVSIEDTDGNVLPLGDDAPFTLETRLEANAPDDIIAIDTETDTVTLSGTNTGQTLLIFELRADGESIFDTESDPATTTVVEPEDVEIDAFHDPHVWVDPVHASSMVEYIAGELGELFPDHDEQFDANAMAYIEEIEAVDEAFESLVDRAELNVAVLVAHDAFQYIEDRYGFELLTPVGVTPDAAESIEDIARLGQRIEEHDIDTILYDPFEASDPNDGLPQAAAILLDDTRAREAKPLTATEGTKPDWQANGYGWVEMMTEVNIPSLEAALRAA